MGQRAIAAVEEMSILTDAVDVKVESLQAEVNLLKLVVGREEDRATWCTCLSDDASANRDKIETWDVLKKELKDQFLPCNTSWFTRESLRKLKHSGTVRDYVKEFSYLMLDIRDMFEENKLFNFLSGLQAWAQTELRCQGIKDLPSAIAATNQLVDFRVTSGSEPEKKKKDSGKDKGKSGKVRKDKNFKKKKNKEDYPKRGKFNTLVVEADDEG
ncbi:UNVERIFIED_CONTAM: hypothetical protein Scaly_1157100 [Sesamum calycinum]|uniref:Retrotransposon gag domain-containing protein n=1 Tax=Sesamum calycinum TaxID=2727403 RepID=A0AAW2Q2D4_9LAMI